MPTGGKETAPSAGVHYGAIAADSSGDVERVIPDGVDTGSFIVQATQPGGNTGTVALGYDESVDQTNGIILTDGDVLSIDLDVDAQGMFAHFSDQGDQIRVIATN